MSSFSSTSAPATAVRSKRSERPARASGAGGTRTPGETSSGAGCDSRRAVPALLRLEPRAEALLCGLDGLVLVLEGSVGAALHPEPEGRPADRVLVVAEAPVHVDGQLDRRRPAGDGAWCGGNDSNDLGDGQGTAPARASGSVAADAVGEVLDLDGCAVEGHVGRLEDDRVEQGLVGPTHRCWDAVDLDLDALDDRQ